MHDASGDRLCGLVNGSVVGGVLPAAQFCNTLTHSVLSLWRVHGVQPFVVHATWMRPNPNPSPNPSPNHNPNPSPNPSLNPNLVVTQVTAKALQEGRVAKETAVTLGAKLRI